MRTILLPFLQKEKKIGKNVIKHLLFDGSEYKASNVEVGEHYIILTNSNQETICIVQKSKNYPSNISKVLTSDKKPTIENIYDPSFLITWLQYPTLNETFEPEAVRNTWINVFSYKEENIEKGIFGLRKPQIAAIFNVLSHWRIGDGMGTVVMPTGTGKTETMLSLLIVQQCKKLLVIVPTDPLREQISKKFITLGYLQKSEFAIVAPTAVKPIVGILNENFRTLEELDLFLEQCNVIVTTMDLISSGTADMQGRLAQKISNLFIDEAHHIKAPTWLNFRKLCNKDKVLQFTATPFRNDGQNIDGKFIFNYPLRKAQEDGYFKKIKLIQVNEWDTEKADKVIAETAVMQLKKDLEKYDHILMARCNTHAKANSVFELYKQYAELNPVVIHTGLSQIVKAEAKRKILNKEAKIIVCVDMLGEGFDLPNLKIAAFHNIRKSLPITVQLAGRFTRTKYDEKLGDASIVVNLKDADVKKELEEFYALGADWNNLLPTISTSRINKEIEFSDFLNGFVDLEKSKIPFQTLKPALSTVVYKNNTTEWFPLNFKEGLNNVDELDYLFHDINRDKKVVVIITGKKNNIDWVYSKDIFDIIWSLYIIHWDTKNNLLFINGSDNAGVYKEMAKAIIGDDAELIDKINVFKAFHGIERVRLQNVGLKEYLGRNISFSMRTGFDIEKALELADKQGAEKAFVFGGGYENGDKISIGCSYKGRIWSRSTGDIQQLIEWCTALGNKLIRDDIDPNTILKETLIPNSVSVRPFIMPFAVDWNEAVFLEPETRITFIINSVEHEFYNTELQLLNPSENGELIFELITPNERIKLKQVLFNNGKYDDFRIETVEANFETYMVRIGRKQYNLESFLYNNPIMWWFVDGSSLNGNTYVELKHLIPNYNKKNIIRKDWSNVNLSKEAQGIDPKITDSIQYKIIQELKEGDYDLIYDDDYSGEIADIIAIKQFDEFINIQLYHLKFAKAGKVSQRVDDLYEVCGQAIKSVNWKFKETKEFFEHLLRREIKKRKGKSCSRIELGSKEKISYLKEIARKRYPVEFEIFIVQPGLSSSNPTVEQLSLLGVANSYMKGKANIPLTVIGSN